MGIALLAVCVAAWLVVTPGSAPAHGQPTERVLVQPATAAARAAVQAVGGTVGRSIELVDGFIAHVPAGASAELTDVPGVRNVTADRVVLPAESGPSTSSGTPLSLVRDAVGASTVPSHTSIGVAQIDTGIADVPALDEVRRGVDTAGGFGRDGYGHGTHVAGIIAGDGQGFSGVAPGARLVSVDTAKSDGQTGLIDVLVAMQWVALHKAEANLRVLNLSLAVDPLADPRIDPMVAGIEALNDFGIVVVVAAGNRGATSAAVTSPGYAPSAITVGAADIHGTAASADDTLAPFSPAGTAQRGVDLVAPGVSITSLRAPGSYIDTNFPSARVGTSLFKGSGTSQAAAVVTGVVADLLASRPNLSPAQVKSILLSSASALPGAPAGSGAGLVNLSRALSAPAGGTGASFGLGSVLGGTGAWTDPWSGNSWGGNSWGGNSWGGNSWGGNSWGGNSWGGNSWGGNSWGGNSWGGNSWGGNSWGGSSWATWLE